MWVGRRAEAQASESWVDRGSSVRPKDVELEGGKDAEVNLVPSAALVLKNDRTGKPERILMFDLRAEGKLPRRLNQ